MNTMSDRLLDELRARIRVDVQHVHWRTLPDERVMAYCPRCLADDRFRSTRAVETRAEALALLNSHLKRRHLLHLYDPRPPLEEQRFLAHAFAV
ncbi:MAG: hypothetical protein DMD97_01625 [Candidatus Rokuibacteriota bacterium]|nr:MAG: hypothetical protein DMD97_01625 [Candidatus Rokubacteria bacterium]